jgi:hypothetical protein
MKVNWGEKWEERAEAENTLKEQWENKSRMQTVRKVRWDNNNKKNKNVCTYNYIHMQYFWQTLYKRLTLMNV